MKSIKRGRGPSGMGAIGSIFAAIFGVFWTVMAVKMGAPFFFPLFGIGFVIMGIIQAIYHYKNAVGKNRFSEYDITENGEEIDPIEKMINEKNDIHYNIENNDNNADVKFCPYCGEKLEKSFEYCPFCGKKMPDLK